MTKLARIRGLLRSTATLDEMPRVPNKSLQVTFDPPPIFAAAKTAVASNAPELRRWAQQ